MNTSLICKLCGENNEDLFRKRVYKNKIYFIKTCKKCEAEQALEYYHKNKEKRAEYQKKYLKKNKILVKSKKKEYDKKRYLNYKEIILSNIKKYSKNNKDLINQRKKEKRKNDPAFRLRHYISTRIRKILKNNGVKNNSCLKYLNYSFLDLKTHIEKQFEDWMNWDNHGMYDPKIWDDNDSKTWKWNIDHIIPQSDLPFSSMDDENFKKCWSLENLRPLSAKINILEGANGARHKKGIKT